MKKDKLHIGLMPIKRGDLLYHDGPLLTHFSDAKVPDIHYLFKWADHKSDYNRWLVCTIDRLALIEFFEKKVSLRFLYETSLQSYIVDYDRSIEIKNIELVGTLPVEYLPHEETFFEEKLYCSYAIALKEQLHAERTITLIKDRLFELLLLSQRAYRRSTSLSHILENMIESNTVNYLQPQAQGHRLERVKATVLELINRTDDIYSDSKNYSKRYNEYFISSILSLLVEKERVPYHETSKYDFVDKEIEQWKTMRY